jgi:pimeloyl-ACP methyl ester carboxylesterase
LIREVNYCFLKGLGIVSGFHTSSLLESRVLVKYIFALLRALDQLADQTGHHELSSAKLIFMGFSGAGPLCARLVALLPDRTVAAILSSSGHYDPVGIDTVKLDQRMLSVPELILAGGADKGRVPLGPMLTSGNIVGGVHHGPLSSRTESHIAVPQMLKN